MTEATERDPLGGPEDDDVITVIEDDAADASWPAGANPWRILVVDDEPDVHEATAFAMRDIEIFGRGIALYHANSAAEALEVLRSQPDIALALVDVVMETTDAGLKLVEQVRGEGLTDLRIVLRTGQPGYAPELSVITDYDINDYRTKSELTRARLLGVVTSAIRSYRQLRQIAASRRGLQQIIEASRDLAARDNLGLFSRGVLTQIASLLASSPDGLACVAQAAEGAHPSIENYVVIGDAGAHQGVEGRRLHEIEDSRVARVFEAALEADGVAMADNMLGMHYSCPSGLSFFVFIDPLNQVDDDAMTLVKVFGSNIAVFLNRLTLIERLDTLAFTDTNVGIPNSNAFRRELEARLEADPGSVVVLMVTVEDLDTLAGAFGLAAKFKALAAVHGRLAKVLGPRAFISWSTSRRFDILVDRESFREGMIAEVFTEPFAMGDVQTFMVATTVVLDVADQDLHDYEDVQQLASATLAHARRDHRGELVHSEVAHRKEVEGRHRMHAALSSALKTAADFQVVLQPKVGMQSGRITGAEALLRWNPGGKPVSPATFIPVAEASGLSWDITRIVLERIGAWSAARRARNEPPLPVAVNLSGFDARHPGFAQRVLACAQACGLSQAELGFEITEGAMLHHEHSAIEELGLLREAGFKVAIDDFGTGYSSLSQLSRLPVDCLKVDRAFVTPLKVETTRDSLAAIITAMAKTLHMQVVAEGIETPEQHQAVCFLGIDCGQGYLYARPTPIDDFDAAFEGWSLEDALQNA